MFVRILLHGMYSYAFLAFLVPYTPISSYLCPQESHKPRLEYRDKVAHPSKHGMMVKHSRC